MATKASIKVADYGGVDGKEEISSMSFYVQDLTALNFLAVTAEVDALKDAIIPTIRGQIRDVTFTKVYPESAALVTDPEAQREDKWLVVYRDTTATLGGGVTNVGFMKLFNFEIPTARLTGFLQANSDVMDLTATNAPELVAAIEQTVRSPYNWIAAAPTIEVVRIVHVGRNT